MKKPNKKDSKYRLLGFFFYWRAYKKDLQLYNDLLYYNPPKLKKKVVKNVIDVKHVKPEIDVRKDKIPEPKSLVDKMKSYTTSWYQKEAARMEESYYQRISPVWPLDPPTFTTNIISAKRKSYDVTGATQYHPHSFNPVNSTVEETAIKMANTVLDPLMPKRVVAIFASWSEMIEAREKVGDIICTKYPNALIDTNHRPAHMDYWHLEIELIHTGIRPPGPPF